jgi:Flp pilus assembly pilin Flp
VTKARNAIALQLVLVLRRREFRSIGREEGQTLAEYAVILGLIAVVVAVAALFFLGHQVQSIFSQIGNEL